MSRSKFEHDNRAPISPLKARRYDTAVQGPLSNKAIYKYALEGRYGEAIQKRAEKLKKRKNPHKSFMKHVDDAIKNKVAELLDGLL